MLRLINFKNIKWRHKSSLRIFISLLLLFAVSRVTGQYNNQRGNVRQPPNYQPPDIQRARSIFNKTAANMLSYMNLEADPCKDFFDFACGNWAESHKSNRFGEITTPQIEAEKSINSKLQWLFTQNLRDISMTERKVLSFYDQCVKEQSTSMTQRSFMIEFVKQLGGIPSMPNTNFRKSYYWPSILKILRGKYGLDILMSFEINNNMDRRSGEAIYLGEPKITIIPPENCSAEAMETMQPSDEYYEALQQTVSQNMQRWLSMGEANANRFGGEVVSFEFLLCKKMRMEEPAIEEEESNNFPIGTRPNQYNNMPQNRFYRTRTTREVNRYSLNQLRQIDSQIENYVLSVLPTTTYNGPVYIRAKDYLRHMAHVTNTSQPATVTNYLIYLGLTALNFPIDDSMTHQAYCIQQVQRHFPRIAGALYARHTPQSMVREEIITEYFPNIQDALDDSFNAEWIADKTKMNARPKVKTYQAAFPVYENLEMNELHIDPKSYWNSLVQVMIYNARNADARSDSIESFEVRAKLMPLESKVLVGQALLQEPFYHDYYPRAMKYAVLGQRLASELAMAFDEEGWRSSPVSHQLLDQYTKDGLKNRTECYRTQYSNYLSNNPELFRNSSRLREIVADSNGLNLAFKSYLKWLESIDPQQLDILRRETMPTVDFTNTQLFFLHFAQSRCTARSGEEPPPEFLPLQRHTPERYDVNGPLSNSAEFAREFRCSPGDEMNPHDKCVIY